MTDQRELDRLLGAYFVDGTDELADRVIDAALDQIDHTQQRRPLRVLRRFQTMPMSARLAAAAVIGVLAVAGAAYLVRPNQPSVGPPGLTPSSSPAGWTMTGSMAEARTDFAATLLPDGRVLVVGGRSPGRTLASAELYDPATGEWSSAGNMSQGRSFPTATLLGNGKVLVVGGNAAIADLYDPVCGTWSDAGTTTDARNQHVAVLLSDGKVLVAGGNQDNGTGIGTAEIYDPDGGTWNRDQQHDDVASVPLDHTTGRRQGSRHRWLQRFRAVGGALRPGQRELVVHGADGQ